MLEVLYVVRVTDLRMSYHEGQSVHCNNSLYVEGCVQMQRGHRIVGGSQCRLGKGFRGSPWISVYILNQRRWGKQFRVDVWEGIIAPFYQDFLS